MQALTNGELVEAQHVHDAYLGYDRPKEVWPLIGAGRHQQATIGPPLHTQQDTLCFLAAMVACSNHQAYNRC